VNNVSLKEISACVGISYAYLRTDIIDRFGHGYSWLKHTIMTEMAARLVLTTDRTLMSISVQCGFSDPKYFIKYFRIFYECNPSDFRKLYQHSISRGDDEYTEISIQNVMQFHNFFSGE
jgi:AraC-like DNA-binding protein